MPGQVAYDVAVIGAGPGGCVTAALLNKAGLRVGIFERARFPRFDSRPTPDGRRVPFGTSRTAAEGALSDIRGDILHSGKPLDHAFSIAKNGRALPGFSEPRRGAPWEGT
jgi:flavin-dependent dehydrogenase